MTKSRFTREPDEIIIFWADHVRVNIYLREQIPCGSSVTANSSTAMDGDSVGTHGDTNLVDSKSTHKPIRGRTSHTDRSSRRLMRSSKPDRSKFRSSVNRKKRIKT